MELLQGQRSEVNFMAAGTTVIVAILSFQQSPLRPSPASHPVILLSTPIDMTSRAAWVGQGGSVKQCTIPHATSYEAS